MVKKYKYKTKTSDELPTDTAQRYKISGFNCIMDSIISSLQKRFIKHKDLYTDMSFFDPRNFPMKSESISGKNIFEKISQLICQHLSENEKSEFGDDESRMIERIEVLLRVNRFFTKMAVC